MTRWRNICAGWQKYIFEWNGIVTIQTAHLLAGKASARSIGCPSDVKFGMDGGLTSKLDVPNPCQIPRRLNCYVELQKL